MPLKITNARVPAMSVQSKNDAIDVLVVDDNVDLCEIVVSTIENTGMSATAVHNASDCDQLIRSLKPNMLVLDLCMPETDGIEMFNSLQSLETKPRIILMSGTGQAMLNVAATLARDFGLDVLGVLEKPFRSDDLRMLLGNKMQAAH